MGKRGPAPSSCCTQCGGPFNGGKIADSGKCRACRAEQKTQWKLQNPRSRLDRYGLSSNDYQEVLEKQDFRCAICGKLKDLQIDHDHACCPSAKWRTCGKCFRGLLCVSCNTKLGWLENNYTEIMAYLKGGDQR